MTTILMAWKASNTFGWGVAGLNIFYHWAVTDDVQPLMMFPISNNDLFPIDSVRLRRIALRVRQSNEFAARLESSKDVNLKINCPVIHALGNRCLFRSGRLNGSKNIGRMVFEDTRLSEAPVKLRRFDALLCASEWNGELLRNCSGREVKVIHEAVDPSIFFPGPRSGLLDPGKFYIFSGGKIEYRKAQDLVLLTFKAFSERHDDVVLVTSWQSPWPKISVGFRGRLPVPLEMGANGRLDIARWVRDNGIDPDKVIDIGTTPNVLMPMVLREMDCALQPSRCEGGTNFVAMEAMACGVPTILANNTGVQDIIEHENCVALTSQSQVTSVDGWGVEGWGESNVEEIVDALEKLYSDSRLRRHIAARGAEFMSLRTWKSHSEELKQWIAGL